MNIQIFGKNKCFDTKKAQRYFKERGISFQYRDLARDGLAPREFDAILAAVKNVDELVDWNSKDEKVIQMKYMDDPAAKENILFENCRLLRTPIVRCGKQVTVGCCPEVWAGWK